LLLLTLAVAPIPLGGNRDWAWSPLAALVGLTLLVDSLGRIAGRRASPALPREMVISMAGVGIAILWAAFQLLPLPSFGAVNSLLSSSAEALGQSASRRMATGAEEAITGIMRLLTYCGVFWLSAQFCRDSRFARRLAWTIVASAVLITLYGLAMQIDNGSCIVLNIAKAPIGSSCAFSGTFRNPDHYAAFAGLGAIVCIAEIQRRLLRIDPSSMNFRLRLRARLAALSASGVAGGASILLIGGLFLSGSKGGAASFLVAVVALVAVLNFASRRRSWATLVSVITISLLVVAVGAIGGEMLAIRLLQFFAHGDSDRLAIYSASLQAIGLRPFAGWGLGSFEGIYTVLQPFSVKLIYTQAHNTFLESAVELGIPVAFCLVGGIVLLVLRCLVGVFQRSRDIHYPAMAVGCAVVVGVHSLFDFSLQIPAVAIGFSALLGMGWAQSRSSRA